MPSSFVTKTAGNPPPAAASCGCGVSALVSILPSIHHHKARSFLHFAAIATISTAPQPRGYDKQQQQQQEIGRSKEEDDKGRKEGRKEGQQRARTPRVSENSHP
jgi:hypothetical protein